MARQRLCIALLSAWMSITTAFGIYAAVPTASSNKSRIGTTAHRHHHPTNRRKTKYDNHRFQLLRNTLRSSPPSRRTLALATALEGGYREIPSHATYEKSSEEHAFIKEALLENVLFSNLPESTLNLLILSFEQTTASRGRKILTQGELCDNDYVYLVGGGECTVIVDGKIVPEPYGTLKPKAIVGEMGVLYNQTRAATIEAKSETVVLYRVHGDTFKAVLNNQSNDDPQLLEKIDQAINQVAGTKSLYGGDIIRTYKSPRKWLWRRWKGTVFQHNWRTVLGNMLISLIFICVTRSKVTALDHSHPWIQRLDLIRKLWSYQMSLTTFILTFFVNQAYSFWQEVHGITRRIQGRLNDFHLLLATNCQRNSDGTYTQASEQLMDSISASSRLFHALFWASCARRFSVLRTSSGLKRMATRGLMTSRQLQVLESLDVPSNQKHNACLEWMMIRANQGMDDGTLRKSDALEQRLLDQMCQLRGTYATIGDKLSCRMPLPYTHFVQVLVDTFIALSPFALYADLGIYSVFGCGFLTLFYTGLLDLAKVFLDPLDNEDFTKNSIDMDLGVLIRESNAGSTRWKNSGARLPFDVPPSQLQRPAAASIEDDNGHTKED